jgi:acetyl coenzyme A synthetase (ADP forming)-like protein
MQSPLGNFLKPEGVAVIGVSTSPSKLGYGIARNLIDSGYPGAIHLVGRQTGELMRHRIHGSIAAVEDPVDLAVIAVPADAVPSEIEQCARRGIRSVIIVTAGFREIGPEGAALERRCVETARRAGVRLLGPNCIGTIDTNLPLDTTFLRPPLPPKGSIAFLSHSGAFCAAIVDWSRQQGFGFSQIVSLGNQADVSETDLLPIVASEPHTRVVVLYLEGLSDGVHFVDVARATSQRTPIVALKVGRSAAGQKAAASHTAALASPDVAFDAAFARAGVLRAESTEQMFDWARALELCPLPGGRRIAILTDAGGPGVIAADAIEHNGLQLAALLPETRTALGQRLPTAASLGNPVDMLASASPDDYEYCLSTLLQDDGVDAVLVVLPPPPMFTAEEVATRILPTIKSSIKPTVVALLGSQNTAAALDVFRSGGIACFPFPERGISALSALWTRAKWRKEVSTASPIARPFPVQAPKDSTVPSLLAAYGIRSPQSKIARSPEEARRVAVSMPAPLVLKISSTEIVHKSDVDGVLPGVMTPEAALRGYAQVVEAVHRHQPSAQIDGVLLQEEVHGGQEVIIGFVRDATFGPLIMFGAGGVEAEAKRDVAFDLVPLDSRRAHDLISRTWAGRRLAGYRSIETVDQSAASDALMRLSWLALEHPEIRELEINPLRVQKTGVLALDIRATT